MRVELKFIWILTTILIVILSTTSAHSAISFSRAKVVFSKLQSKANRYVVLKLIRTNKIQAYGSPYGIAITQGMLNYLNTDDELIMVLGHELAHYVYQHPRYRLSSKSELEADQRGYQWCKSMGYKYCKRFLERMRKDFGEGGDKYHPTWSERLRRLRR